MDTATLTAWTLAAALHFAPPSQHPQYPGFEESQTEAEARYASIATDIAEAAHGDKSRAALLLAIGIGESALALDADRGKCYRGKDRHSPLRARCDSGLASSVFQLHRTVSHPGDWFADRAEASRFVIRLAIGSFKMCSALPIEDQLSGMGLGHCEEGNASVRARFRLYKRLQSWEPK